MRYIINAIKNDITPIDGPFLYTNNMHKNIANRSREIFAMKSVIILKKFFILPL